MTPLPKDSLDTVEMVMVIEEVFGTEIPTEDGEGFSNPREIVDWRISRINGLINKQPTS